MDELSKEHLAKIHVQLVKLNGFLKIMLTCLAVVTFTLVAEVSRHW